MKLNFIYDKSDLHKLPYCGVNITGNKSQKYCVSVEVFTNIECINIQDGVNKVFKIICKMYVNPDKKRIALRSKEPKNKTLIWGAVDPVTMKPYKFRTR
jgi:hypothetical protein